MNDTLLIDLVREHGVLYNHNLLQYKDLSIRQAAWEEIGQELGVPGSEAKQHWAMLRRCYANARNRRRDYSLNGKKLPVWKYEQQMSFILPFSLASQKSGSNNTKSTTVNTTIKSENITSEIGVDGMHDPLQDCEHEGPCVPVDIKREDTPNIAKRKITNNTVLNKQKIQKRITPEIPSNFVQKSQVFETTIDETDMFFLSMSKMVKKLPINEQSPIKLILSNAVLSAEMRCNQSVQNESNGSSSEATSQQMCEAPPSPEESTNSNLIPESYMQVSMGSP